MRSRIQHCRLSLFAHLSSRIFTLLAPLLSRLAHVPLLSLPVRSPLSLPLHPCRPLHCPPPLPPHPCPPLHCPPPPPPPSPPPPFTHLLAHSLTSSPIHSPPRPFTHLLAHSLTPSPIPSPPRPFTWPSQCQT